mgnify:CR=1 FL=1
MVNVENDNLIRILTHYIKDAVVARPLPINSLAVLGFDALQFLSSLRVRVELECLGFFNDLRSHFVWNLGEVFKSRLSECKTDKGRHGLILCEYLKSLRERGAAHNLFWI